MPNIPHGFNIRNHTRIPSTVIYMYPLYNFYIGAYQIKSNFKWQICFQYECRFNGNKSIWTLDGLVHMNTIWNMVYMCAMRTELMWVGLLASFDSVGSYESINFNKISTLSYVEITIACQLPRCSIVDRSKEEKNVSTIACC